MSTPQPLPQLTFRAVLLAIILAVILAAANTYLGLFAGLTIASAIPAAVVSMGVLKVFGGGHILENNIVQTGASAGSSIAAGVIFTLPALVLLGYWTDYKYMWVVAVAALGGILGVLFSVPLRRSLIIEQKLAFPEGKAAAEVLRTGENPAHGVKLLAGSALLGAFGKMAASSGLKLIPDTAGAGAYAGKSVWAFGTNLSPALLGVGYIVGLNIGIVVLVGGLISWALAIPIFSAFFLDGNPELVAKIAKAVADAGAEGAAEAAAGTIWNSQIRYLGVGAMLIGGVWTLFSLRNSLLSGIRSGLKAARAGADKTIAHTEQDLPMRWVLVGIVLFALPLWALYQGIVGSVMVSLPMTLIMIVAGFLFCAVAAYMAGLVGSSNNPVSGMTIATIAFASLILILLMGRDAPQGPMAAIMIGAVVCCAACIAGDNLQDLKAGQLVGATPWRQQVMLAIGALSCALVMGPVLQLLTQAYGIGDPTTAHPNPLAAPQANLIASVTKGMFGGALPWNMVWIGAGVGAVIIAIDEFLKRSGKAFRMPVLAAAVGIYLPLDLSVPIFLGGLLAYFVEKKLGGGQDQEAKDRLHQKGILFAAGLITGEALMGIIMAFPIVAAGPEKSDVMALPERFQLGHWAELAGIVFLAAVAWLLYRAAVKQKSRT